MKVLYHFPYPDRPGAGRWIYEGWRDRFLSLGHEVHVLRDEEETADKAREVMPDLVFADICITRIENEKVRATLDSMRQRGGKVLPWVYLPLYSCVA